MGGCNSCEATAVAAAAAAASSSAEAAEATAKVVLGDGRLQEFAGPARARHVLQKVVGGGGFAVCSADDVELGERVAAVGPDEELQAGQLYFLLPAGMLRRRVRAEDMAELALRASAALVGHAGPLVFPARHADKHRGEDMLITTTTTTTRRQTRAARRRPSAKARDFASHLTSIEE
ncbi:hypothetical protein ACMD2_16641 [Ananas comosus]|uniref:Uncharacterized protein n=1 Tax=Ananas comosus TaxID=4615 RepID=A0A199W0X3_ANACO|nr:hypothetical protein ACMD2_16641 [Ananas comosus]